MSRGNGINNNSPGVPYTDINSVDVASGEQALPQGKVDETKQQTSVGDRCGGSRLRERKMSNSSEISNLSVSSPFSSISVNWDEAYGPEPDHLELVNEINDAYKISGENGRKVLNEKFQLLIDANKNKSGVKTKFLRFYMTFMEQADTPIALKDAKVFFDEKTATLGCDKKHTKKLNNKFKSCFKESVRKHAADLKFMLSEKMRLSFSDLKEIENTVEACKKVDQKLLHTVRVSGRYSAGTWIRRAATEASKQHLMGVEADVLHWYKPSNSSADVIQTVVNRESDGVYSILDNVIEACSDHKSERKDENIEIRNNFRERMKPLIHKRQIDEAVKRTEMPPEQLKLYDELMKASGDINGVNSLTNAFHGICKQFDQKTVDGLSNWFDSMESLDWSRLPAPARHCGGPMQQALNEASRLGTSKAKENEFTVPENREELKGRALEYVKRMKAGETFSASDLTEIQRIVNEVDPTFLEVRVKRLRLGTHLRRVAMKASEDVLHQTESDVNKFHGAMNSSAASVGKHFDNKVEDINTTLTNIIDKCSRKKTVRNTELRGVVETTKKAATQIIDGRKLLEVLGYDSIPPREVKLFNQLLRVGKGLDTDAMSERLMKYCSRMDQDTVGKLVTHLGQVDLSNVPAGYQSIRHRCEVMLQVLGQQQSLSRSASENSVDSGVSVGSEALPLETSMSRRPSTGSLESGVEASPKPVRKGGIRPQRKAPLAPPKRPEISSLEESGRDQVVSKESENVEPPQDNANSFLNQLRKNRDRIIGSDSSEA